MRKLINTINSLYSVFERMIAESRKCLTQLVADFLTVPPTSSPEDPSRTLRNEWLRSHMLLHCAPSDSVQQGAGPSLRPNDVLAIQFWWWTEYFQFWFGRPSIKKRVFDCTNSTILALQIKFANGCLLQKLLRKIPVITLIYYQGVRVGGEKTPI